MLTRIAPARAHAICSITHSTQFEVHSPTRSALRMPSDHKPIRSANDRPVDASQARDMLRKALQKHEADSVVEAYNSADTVNMPAGNSMWRLSNAISWVAGKTGDTERKLEISKVAGQVLIPA